MPSLRSWGGSKAGAGSILLSEYIHQQQRRDEKNQLTWHIAAGASASTLCWSSWCWPWQRSRSSSLLEINKGMQQCSSEYVVCVSQKQDLRKEKDQLSCHISRRSRVLDLHLLILAVLLEFRATSVCWNFSIACNAVTLRRTFVSVVGTFFSSSIRARFE